MKLADIRSAHARIARHIHHTPVLHSAALDERAGATVAMKAEHLQRGGAFKLRGAMNAVLSLPDPLPPGGVAAHSSGNHAAALSIAARARAMTAHVVMPHTAPAIKQAAVREYGGIIEFCEPTQAAREAGLAALVERTGAEVIHPYDDWRIIAGQGTAALELLEEVPDLDAIVVPVGGGGLISGTALAAKGLKPDILVWGVKPAAAPDTIADGLQARIGVRNTEVIERLVDEIVTVSEEAIVAAMRFAWERTKQLIEPSAATVIAVLLDRPARLQGRRVGVILSGGNCDLDRVPWREA